MSETRTIQDSIKELAAQQEQISDKMINLIEQVPPDSVSAPSLFITGLSVFVLACFVGYHVVWRVTPALHSPLMGITNAISSVIIVGAIIALGTAQGAFSSFLAFLAVVLASINIFGGFIITRRMLHMFKKKG